LNDRAVHIELTPVDSALGVELALQMPHDRFKSSVFGPAPEPAVYRFPVAVPLRNIPPGSAGVQDPKDAVDDLAVIIVQTTAAFDLWKKRFDTFVLLVSELIAASRHTRTA
jgi:hypothetical protein